MKLTDKRFADVKESVKTYISPWPDKTQFSKESLCKEFGLPEKIIVKILHELNLEGDVTQARHRGPHPADAIIPGEHLRDRNEAEGIGRWRPDYYARRVREITR